MNWGQAAALTAVSLYQRVLGPVLGGQCRFAPSCSEYARQAVMEHGVAQGAWLAVRRLLSCHPFHPGGYDPPPRRRP
jgi:putative membrane protein insertion efficiency factor